MIIEVGNYTIIGRSIAGRYTSLVIKELKICFDLGYLSDASIACKNIFISHGHLDHIACIPLHHRQRVLQKHKHKSVTTYYLPEVCLEAVNILSNAFFTLDGKNLDDLEESIKLKLKAIQPNETIYLNSQTLVKAFMTIHRVPSLGYVVFDRKSKLLPKYLTLTGAEIAKLRQDPTNEVLEIVDTPILAYTGDTVMEGIIKNPEFGNSKILIMECSFLQDISVEEAQLKGHIHIQDILDHRDYFQCEHLVLCHLSPRYLDQNECSEAYRLIKEIDFEEQMKPIEIHWLIEPPIN